MNYIIDGGFLLHHVIWPANLTYKQLYDEYVTYVKRHYGENSIVVFDGYSNQENSTKTMEQKRRAMKKQSIEINFNQDMVATTAQEGFF